MSHKKGDFYYWLCNYLKVNGLVNPIADLAADVQSDPTFPRGRGNTLEDFKYYHKFYTNSKCNNISGKRIRHVF